MARFGILAWLIPSLLGACSSPSAAVSPHPVAAGVPSEVAGLPVISVASADELLRSGKLDGEAAAVAGYFNQFTPSCPYPGGYTGPLESWCRFVTLTDSRTKNGARLVPDATLPSPGF